MSTPTFREMTLADVAAGLGLCRAARWNQTARDWELFLTLNPGGARVALDGDRVVGTVATLRYQDRFAWVSMVLVDPAARGRGVGTALLHEGLRLLDDMPSVRLDATPAGRLIYVKLGFEDEYPLSRMESGVGRKTLETTDNPARPMTRDDLKAVIDLDGDAFGADRARLLEWLFEGAPELGFVVRREGRVRGYVLGRHGFDFDHVGPVVAEDAGAARSLVSACLTRLDGKAVILDAPHHSPEWLGWLSEAGFKEQRPFTRMFLRGNPHAGAPQRCFAIAGPELG